MPYQGKQNGGRSLLTVHYYLLAVLLFITLSVSASNSGKLNSAITIDNISVSLNRFSSFVFPGDTISIAFNDSSVDQFEGQYAEGTLIKNNQAHWQFVAPEKPGYYKLVISNNNTSEKFILNVFVMVPASEQKGEYLNGYHIGMYPDKAFRDLSEYNKPKGFVEVSKANMDVYVSPHLQLKQFICKQQPDHWPKYILLRPEILLKLELLLEKLNSIGIETNTIFLMSGYRTPYYNASIGNGRYSRHIYGDATDVYVDVNKDGKIDDLNKDGKISMKDAVVIYNIINAMDNDPKYKYLIGGLGKYKKTKNHTWNVHIDTRGYKARW